MISSHIIQRLGGAITKLLGNRFSIINAAPPASAAGILKGGPEAGVVREIGVDADLGVEVTSHEPFEITEVVDASRKVHGIDAVSYTHPRAHETVLDFVCRPSLEKKKLN